jgi:hypothetical protein
MMLLKLRPSSHSEDVSIIATYKSAKTATKAAAQLNKFLTGVKDNPQEYDLDWDPNEAEIFTVKNKLHFSVYTSGYLEEVDEIIGAHHPKETVDYANYQEVEIEATVPKNLTPATMVLVLTPTEIKTLKWLKLTVGEPTVKNNGKTQQLKWHYQGNGILYNNTLEMDGTVFDLDEHPNWQADYE